MEAVDDSAWLAELEAEPTGLDDGEADPLGAGMVDPQAAVMRIASTADPT